MADGKKVCSEAGKKLSENKLFMRHTFYITLAIFGLMYITGDMGIGTAVFGVINGLLGLLAYLAPSSQEKDKAVYIVKQCPCCRKCSCMKCVEVPAEHREGDENSVETAVESSSNVAGDTPRTRQ